METSAKMREGFDHVMVDLETYGTMAGCSIMSIGAVAFGKYVSSIEQFHVIVQRESCKEVGLKEEVDTLIWWEKQSEEAKETLRLSNDGEPQRVVSIHQALEQFNHFLRYFGPGVKLWGNGSDFDNTILIAAYRACDILPVWKFYNNRCYRTLKSLHREVPLESRAGIHHNALDDAITQANHAVRIFGHIEALRGEGKRIND